MPNRLASVRFEGQERRLRARFRTPLPFVLRSNDQEVRGVTRNVSLLGISAYTDNPLSQGQPVQCFLELPSVSKTPIIASGTVIRCHPASSEESRGNHEVGVFFRSFQGKDESELSKYLRQIARQEQETVKTGYRILKERLAARRRRKRSEELRKRRRRQERLRRRKLRLAKQKRRASRQLHRRGRPRKKR